MKWCMAIGVALYTVIIATFAGIFKKFTYHYRQFHTMNEMHKQSNELSLEERNKKYQEFTQANSRCRWAARRQMTDQQRADWWSRNEQNFPSFMRPHITEAFRQQEQRPVQVADTENVPVAAQVHQP